MTQQLEVQPRPENNEEIKFWVNEEEVVYSYQKPDERAVFKLSVRDILTLAGFTPAENFELTRDSDNQKFPSLGYEVPVEQGDHFTAKYNAPTPAS